MAVLIKKKFILQNVLATVSTKTELEYAIDIKTILDIYHIKRTEIDGAIISSVVPQITNAAKLAVHKILHKDAMVLGPWDQDRIEYHVGQSRRNGS